MIDVARLNELPNPSQPSETIVDNFSQQSDDAPESMQVDQSSEKRTLRRRKEKVHKNLKRGVNEKEIEAKDTEQDRHMIFNQVREKMQERITLKKKSDPGKFAVPCLVKGIECPCALCDTGLLVIILPKIGNALVPVDFQGLDNKLNINHSLLLGREFMATVGAVCNMQTNQLSCYCKFKAEYETEFEASIDSQTYTSIDSAIQPTIDNHRKNRSTAVLRMKLSLCQYTAIRALHWADDSHHENFAVDTALPEMQSDEYDGDYHREKNIKDPEGQEQAMDGRILNISKEDTAEIIAMNWKRKPYWEMRHEYGVISTVPEQATYSKADVDELVTDIYRAMRTTDDYHSKRLDDVYYPFDNSISWLTTRTDEMKQDIAMI
ncbi:hypothetical protein F2Q70_00003571 [Brassica cretica]|uniref:Uncharacterized protein n=1 Tax=Brassica cretica TaxID=69181 RepID=A0A8S9IX25_BRACR|nr:hypothetical protein F2Q70_00003571 [Brassica cretica]